MLNVLLIKTRPVLRNAPYLYAGYPEKKGLLHFVYFIVLNHEEIHPGLKKSIQGPV